MPLALGVLQVFALREFALESFAQAESFARAELFVEQAA